MYKQIRKLHLKKYMLKAETVTKGFRNKVYKNFSFSFIRWEKEGLVLF